MDLTPRGIREHLDLNRPIYARTSAYGHFGRAPDTDGGFSWERTDLADAIQTAAAAALKPRAAPWSERRDDAAAAALVRAPARPQAAAARQRRLLDELLPRAAPRLSASPAPLDRCRRCSRTASDALARDRLRRRRASASAQAARASRRRAHRLRAVPGRRRQGRSTPIEAARAGERPPASRTTRAPCCAGCRRARIDRVFVLFPDPWPKLRHPSGARQRGDCSRCWRRVMRPGGELRLATDIGDYARAMLLALRGAAAFRLAGRRRPRTGASARPTGRRRATRRRPCGGAAVPF